MLALQQLRDVLASARILRTHWAPWSMGVAFSRGCLKWCCFLLVSFWFPFGFLGSKKDSQKKRARL